VDVKRFTLMAFAIGASYGGFAGSLMAPLVQFIDPMSFTLVISLKVLLMVVVGGSGYFLGPLLGAGLVILMPEFLRFADGYYLIIYAGLVLVLMVFCPKGLMGMVERIRERYSKVRVVRADLKEGAQL
jgi:branched-chain amino acid transport system permease protein